MNNWRTREGSCTHLGGAEVALRDTLAAGDGGERQHSQQLKIEVEYEAANGPSSEPLHGGRPARTTGKRKPDQS